MGGQVRVVWDESAVRMAGRDSPSVRAGMDRLAGQLLVAMKRLCPVSPVYPTYAAPVPPGSSKGQAYQARGKGVAWPGGGDVSRSRAAGDLPLRPSGYLRNSIRAFRMADGSVVVGPVAPYGKYVNAGTPPHIIRSTGPWPLRNRATGQVFGPLVHHPGTPATHFIERAVFTLRGVVIRL